MKLIAKTDFFIYNELIEKNDLFNCEIIIDESIIQFILRKENDENFELFFTNNEIKINELNFFFDIKY